MKKYLNLSGNDESLLYDYDDNSITIIFKGKENGTGIKYLYTTESMSISNINQMKMLADQGKGLRTFINKNKRSKVVNHFTKQSILIDDEEFV